MVKEGKILLGNLQVGNEWYNFDDSHVSSTSASSVQSSSAYVLFYRRKQLGVPSAVEAAEKHSDGALETAQEEATAADGDMLT